MRALGLPATGAIPDAPDPPEDDQAEDDRRGAQDDLDYARGFRPLESTADECAAAEDYYFASMEKP